MRRKSVLNRVLWSLRSAAYGIALASAACGPAIDPGQTTAEMQESAPHACSVSEADQAWLHRSLEAWHFAQAELTEIGSIEQISMVVFDATCTLTSDNAMAGGSASGARFQSVAHNGRVALPGGGSIPAAVTSFTQSDGDHAFFVMALPSLWETGGVTPGPLGLDDLTTAVLLHEGSHVVQFPTYGAQITALAERYQLPPSFNDDSAQEVFEQNEAFAASIARETELLLAAASAEDLTNARQLAGEAREFMRVRRSTYFVGEYAYMAEAQDLWLTLEGTGQWVGHAWLLHPQGGARDISDAHNGFGQRSKWWTQNLGLALVMALDRLGYDWKPIAFGTAEKTVIQMLDEALAAP